MFTLTYRSQIITFMMMELNTTYAIKVLHSNRYVYMQVLTQTTDQWWEFCESILG